MSRSTPWAQWMRIGLGVMGLSAQAFWSLSLREWTLALEGLMGARGAVRPLSRAELERLIGEDGGNCHPRAAQNCGDPGADLSIQTVSRALTAGRWRSSDLRISGSAEDAPSKDDR